MPDDVAFGIRMRRMIFTTLIQPADLQTLVDNNAVCLIDCRHDLGNPDAGRHAYAEGHLPAAHFLHLDEDLSGVKNGRNGRHPLPDPAQLAARLGILGIRAGMQVVAYDDSGGMFAARLWWLLRWLGHPQVAVLDGGVSAWRGAGLPLTQDIPVKNPVDFPYRIGLPTVSADDVLQSLSSSDSVLIDARAPDRFRGENETLDPVAGHIPGALNRFFRDNLAADGRFKPAAQLRAEFTELLQQRLDRRVIQQCGSGVTACHNLLAMEIAGLDGSILYPGSWSEWCSDPTRPMVVG